MEWETPELGEISLACEINGCANAELFCFELERAAQEVSNFRAIAHTTRHGRFPVEGTKPGQGPPSCS